MPTPKQQRRRALELLEASIDGCTEAIMRAQGFTVDMLVELINAGLASASPRRGGRRWQAKLAGRFDRDRRDIFVRLLWGQ
jgi:hypothetical protein